MEIEPLSWVECWSGGGKRIGELRLAKKGMVGQSRVCVMWREVRRKWGEIYSREMSEGRARVLGKGRESVEGRSRGERVINDVERPTSWRQHVMVGCRKLTEEIGGIVVEGEEEETENRIRERLDDWSEGNVREITSRVVGRRRRPEETRNPPKKF